MNFSVTRWAPLLLIASWTLSSCSSRPTGPVWNVPELLGKPIDVVKQKLGAPQSETALDGGVQQSTWQKQDTTLVATWKPTNKRVREWTLTARDESHAVREEERAQLLQVGQLKENVSEYTVDWVEATERPLYYTGVKVIPALKNHNVTLRLTGPTALVGISYTTTGPQGKTDTFDTISPWEEQSLVLPDDTQVTLSAVLRKSLDPATSTMKLEIIVDGKVVDTASSTGGLIRCQTEL